MGQSSQQSDEREQAAPHAHPFDKLQSVRNLIGEKFPEKQAMAIVETIEDARSGVVGLLRAVAASGAAKTGEPDYAPARSRTLEPTECPVSMKNPFANLGILIILLAGFGAADGGDGRAEKGRPVDSRNGVAVSGYCENFARKYSEDNAIDYQESSVKVEKKSDVMMHLSNLFSPSHSKFTSGYDCHFQARGRQGEAHDISVGLFLTGTLHFAEYTKWERLQIIPVEYVVDQANDRAGYGVFKYLEKP